MQTEEGFLKAIHQHPDDETAWLVLADWLEEQGQAERAELLRVRQRLLSLGETAQRTPLEERLRALLAAGARPPVPEVRNGLGMRLALVPPGRFLMGSPESEEDRYVDEGPQHEVVLTRAFYLGVFPVTQEEYERVVGMNPARCRRGRGLRNSKQMPVEMISWDDTQAFCKRLNDFPEERKARRRYTLPTEAQWEYACRAGTSTPFSFGHSLRMDQANVGYVHPRDNPSGLQPVHRPSPVGSYPPNAFGLYDLHGNVWEWCLDFYRGNYYKKKLRVDPTGPKRGPTRVLRGGDWRSSAAIARSADRGHNEAGARHDYNGFRVALVQE